MIDILYISINRHHWLAGSRQIDWLELIWFYVLLKDWQVEWSRISLHFHFC